MNKLYIVGPQSPSAVKVSASDHKSFVTNLREAVEQLPEMGNNAYMKWFSEVMKNSGERRSIPTDTEDRFVNSLIEYQLLRVEQFN